MGVYRLSNESETDIAGIYEYGIEKFGILQAQEYLIGLHNLFQTLTKNPYIGRDASEFSPSLIRFNYKSHMVFYLKSDSDISIVRVLHQSMDYPQYL